MSKTEQILSILREELRSGRYKAGTKFPSEQKLMARFDAARTTVNKVTAQLAAEGFIERGVQGSGTRVREPSPFPIGQLAYLGSISHAYYARMIDGLQRTAFLKDHAVSFFSPGQDQVFNCLEKIRHSKYRGLLVSNIGIIPDPFPIPVVYLDNAFPADRRVKASVTCTNYQGAYDMAEAVIAHGHREILIASSLENFGLSCEERIRGFLDALNKHGLPISGKQVFRQSIGSPASTRFLLRDAMKQYPETTAIMCDSDNVAMRLYQAMQDIQLPHPVALTGFGNLASAGELLRLPGVEQHPEEIGAQGVNELLRMIADPEYVSPGRIEIETELVNLDKLPMKAG